MQPITHIRKSVFGLTQAAFAEVAGTTQATVSRWEAGEFEPDRDDLARIRSAALERDLPWDDRWFFEAPPNQS
jgi:transcriptional regulator with XRE-family HTH domain